jgi:uncharacterized protein YneF (UPF0154 family)
MPVYEDAAEQNLLGSAFGRKLLLFIAVSAIGGIFFCTKFVYGSLRTNPTVGGFTFALVLLLIVISICYCVYYFLGNWIFRIETSDESITIHTLLKSTTHAWSEVEAISLDNSLGERRVVRVNSKSGDFTFNITMKDIGEEYPQLSKDFKHGNCWIDEKHITTPLTAENCKLFQEIKRRVGRVSAA